MKNQGKFISTAGITVLFIALISFMFKEKILLAFGNYLIIEDDLTPVDVIQVIAGEDYRTEYAIDLYKQGYSKYIFFTGGWCKTHGWAHGVHGKELALSEGLPADAIAYDDSTVTSTYSETLLLKRWIEMSPEPIRSVMVVSDPFHMRRTSWTFQNVFGKGMNIKMAPVPFNKTPYKQQWWTHRLSKRYVSDEYKKTVYYLLRYRLSWGWIKWWLASLDTG